MNTVVIYLRLYRDCLLRALRGIAKNAWTLLLPMLSLLLVMFLSPLLGRIDFVGGILMLFVTSALASAYLYFTGEVVAHSRVTLAEWKTSLGAYLWSVINLNFVLWVVGLVLERVAASGAGAQLILAFNLIALIVLNAAPEVIYQRGTRGGLDTIQGCVRFLQDNWIEWFIPNLLAGALLWGVAGYALRLGLVGPVLLGAVLHVVMVFRGHLFRSLDGSTHRQRMFKFRNATIESEH